MPALIFDCDGVLADTERYGHLPAFNAAFAEFGLDLEWSPERYGELLQIGGGKERMKVDISDEELIAKLHARKTQLFTELVDSGAVPPRPGAARLIHEALAAGWIVAIASTSAERSVRAVLRSVAGEEAAEQCHVYAGDIVAKKKPAPDIYQLVLKDLSLDPAECVVVEDSGIGLAAAVAAGLTTIVTISAYTGEDDFTGAAVVLPDLGEAGDEHLVALTDVAALLPKQVEEEK